MLISITVVVVFPHILHNNLIRTFGTVVLWHVFDDFLCLFKSKSISCKSICKCKYKICKLKPNYVSRDKVR